MTKIAYYPGCSLLGSSREYDESLRAIAGPMGFDLVQVPDWNCCGASSAHTLNHELSLALPARILALAETLGVEEMLVSPALARLRIDYDGPMARLADLIQLTRISAGTLEVRKAVGREITAVIRK